MIKFIKVAASMTYYAIMRLPTRGILFWANNVLFFIGILACSFRDAHPHIKILRWIWPSLFTPAVRGWLYQQEWWVHLMYLTAVWLGFHVAWLGFAPYRRVKRLGNALQACGIKNSNGIPPKVIDYEEISPFRSVFTLRTDGIEDEEFTSKVKKLEASTGQMIEGIVRQPDPRFVKLYVTMNYIPKNCSTPMSAASSSKPTTLSLARGCPTR